MGVMLRSRMPRFTACWVLLGAGSFACGDGTTTRSIEFDSSVVDSSPALDSAPDPGLKDAGAFDSADAAGCNVINIGILGNPGSNPSSNFQTWLTKAGTTVKRIQTTANVPLTAPDLSPFNVIILDFLTRDYTSQESAIVRSFVEAGGGLISMSGYNGTTDDFRANPMIGALGVTYGGPLQNGPVTTFVAHPITSGLASVTFNGGYVVSASGPTNYKRTPIASIPAGNVAWAIEAVSGRAFVWGDEWIEFDSEWSTIPQIKALWVNIFGWVAPTGCPLVPPPN